MSKPLARRIAAATSCLGLCAFGLWGCGGSGSSATQSQALPAAVEQAVRSSTPVDSNLVAANNSVGFDLFNQLVQQNPSANVFISPTSIALALEIVENGANGATLTAMGQTLHLPSTSLSDINTGNAALQASLVNPDPKVALTIANSLWIHKATTQVNPTFIQTNTNYYGSTVGDLAGAPANVNAWVSQQTNGNITSILPAGNYSSWVFAVINAVYFKGAWTTPFDPGLTTSVPFTLLNGTTKTCNLMQRQGTYTYYSGANFQAVRLPYGSNRMSMVMILPNQGVNWTTFLATLTPQNLTTWLSQATSNFGSVALPRFQTGYDADLIPSLTSLGMGIAFTSQADLSGIAPGTMLTYVHHKTFLNVTEQGTEAGAATGIGGATAVAVNSFTFRADHPFFCAIQDDKTGTLLFLGCILDPTATAQN
jgi:serine protease inhibitor